MSSFFDHLRKNSIIPVLKDAIGSIAHGTCNLAHFVPGNLYGGIEKIILEMRKFRMELSNIQQTYFLLWEGQFGLELGKGSADYDVLGPVRRRYPWQVWLARRRFKKTLLDRRVHLVLFHSTWAYSLFASCAKKAGVKVGLWIHDEAKAGGHSESICGKTSPDLLLCNSRFISRSAKFIFPKTDCRIAYPVSANPQTYTEADRLEVRQLTRNKLGCPSNRKVILIAARFDEYKGHRLLFEGLEKINKKGTLDWECWVAGKPRISSEMALKASLENKAIYGGFSKKIRWLDHQSDLGPFYASADVYCQPNIGPEPFGMVFYEAQLAKCPVVTTAMGGAIESVEPHYPNRFLEKPCPDSLASILSESLLNDVRILKR